MQPILQHNRQDPSAHTILHIAVHTRKEDIRSRNASTCIAASPCTQQVILQTSSSKPSAGLSIKQYTHNSDTGLVQSMHNRTRYKLRINTACSKGPCPGPSHACVLTALFRELLHCTCLRCISVSAVCWVSMHPTCSLFCVAQQSNSSFAHTYTALALCSCSAVNEHPAGVLYHLLDALEERHSL